MKKILYILLIGIIVSVVVVIISFHIKATPLGVSKYEKTIYSISELCIDLKSYHYDFSVYPYTNGFFLSTTSKEIKINNNSIYVYIYGSNEKMDYDAKKLLTYQEEVKTSLFNNYIFNLFYKKDRIIVQYAGDDQNLKKSLDSILGRNILNLSKSNLETKGQLMKADPCSCC